MLVTTNTPAAPEDSVALGATDHDKAMVAKVDGVANPAAASESATTRPDHIPEKFWDAEKGVAKVDEMAKSYAELEKSRSASDKPADVNAPALDAATKAAEDAAKAAGGDTAKVDFAALSAEYAAQGQLSDESFAKLEAAGLTRDTVDRFIAGEQAVFNAQVAEAHAVAGGQQQYAVMTAWAMSNLPASEQEAFDRAVVSDAATRNMAITAMKARFEAAVGKDPALLQGSGGAPKGADGYQSRAEVTKDMSDPRYKRDPAFRATVERKLANSSVF